MRTVSFFGWLVPMVMAGGSLWNWEQTNATTPYGRIPRPRSYLGEYPSACANGGGNAPYGFACPHMMMLSDDMILASRRDRLEPHFVYAVAGASSDSECGMCYQVKLLDAEREWRPTFKQLVVQVINSGFDVLPHQLDLFMGAGGFGYFTSCNKDCYQKFCQGGPCKDSMYESSFVSWNQAQYPDQGPHSLCYSGGIKWLDKKNNTALMGLCKKLTAGRKWYSDNITVDSCYRTNTQLYHQNFVSIDLRRVRCPESLTFLTGLRRADDASFPSVSITNTLPEQCRGDRSQGHFCITTMQDGCKPSCSWSGKGNPDPQWPRADVCKKNGLIFDY